MNFIKHIQELPMGCCLHCGSFRPNQGLLCGPCTEVLRDREGLRSLERGPFKAWSLFPWNPNESDLLSALIVSLKGSHRKTAWKHYANWFARQRLAAGIPEGLKICIVPAPSSGRDRKHAHHWAEGLASALGGEVFDILEKAEKVSQRGATREERQLLRLCLRENISLEEGESEKFLWILADDILTTGATAQAAFRALGSPPHFEAWLLGCRGALLRSVQGSDIQSR